MLVRSVCFGFLVSLSTFLALRELGLSSFSSAIFSYIIALVVILLFEILIALVALKDKCK